MHDVSLLRRLGAIVYDTLLIIALLFPVTIIFMALHGGDGPVQPGELLYTLTLFATAWVFFISFWVRTGRTLGMQSWGLRIETKNGKQPDVTTTTVRFFTAILSWLPFGLGFWWQLWDNEKLTWHDRLSGTRLRYYPSKGSDKN